MKNFKWKAHLFPDNTAWSFPFLKTEVKLGSVAANQLPLRLVDAPQPHILHLLIICARSSRVFPRPHFPQCRFFATPRLRLFLHWKIVSPWIKLECSAHMPWKKGTKMRCWVFSSFVLLIFHFPFRVTHTSFRKNAFLLTGKRYERQILCSQPFCSVWWPKYEKEFGMKRDQTNFPG